MDWDLRLEGSAHGVPREIREAPAAPPLAQPRDLSCVTASSRHTPSTPQEVTAPPPEPQSRSRSPVAGMRTHVHPMLPPPHPISDFRLAPAWTTHSLM